jgi:hypothetical protein
MWEYDCLQVAALVVRQAKPLAMRSIEAVMISVLCMTRSWFDAGRLAGIA